MAYTCTGNHWTEEITGNTGQDTVQYSTGNHWSETCSILGMFVP